MPKLKPLPPLDFLENIFSLDPDAGVLTRRSTNLPAYGEKKFNGTRLSKLNVYIQDSKFAYHRVVWKMYHGTEPPAIIDHIDRDVTNNRPSNLRGASPRQNSENTARFTKGLTKVGLKYRARVTIAGYRCTIGNFHSAEAAAAARIAVLAAVDNSST